MVNEVTSVNVAEALSLFISSIITGNEICQVISTTGLPQSYERSIEPPLVFLKIWRGIGSCSSTDETFG